MGNYYTAHWPFLHQAIDIYYVYSNRDSVDDGITTLCRRFIRPTDSACRIVHQTDRLYDRQLMGRKIIVYQSFSRFTSNFLGIC